MGVSSGDPKWMEQGDLTSRFCARPQSYAWFLGAGTSASAGLPTAADVLWDLKRRYYCREENQEITRQDLQNEAVRAKIQTFMEARGFPELWADDEYPSYFEKIFGDDKERQRRYLKGILTEEKASLSVGNRVLGAFMACCYCRVAFTTNFDSIVEKSVAEVAGRSLAAFHLEGSHAANQALNNEEFPIYCKLHGDFRYDSLKNLPADLSTQNASLAECLHNAGSRFGFIVTGYSGRDQSIMDLFRVVLSNSNPFPHGLFWTGIKGSQPRPQVEELLEQARAVGVDARLVPIETFDALMLRLWRNIENKPEALDAQVRRTKSTTVNIPLPQPGVGQPLVRLNALPIVSLPRRCLELSFKTPKSWNDVVEARAVAGDKLILTKGEAVWCWGRQDAARGVFGGDLVAVIERDLSPDLLAPDNLYVKGFVEEALCRALARARPLTPRISRYDAALVVSESAEAQAALQPLAHVVGKTSGVVPGVLTGVTEDHPIAEKVRWAEAVRISIDIKEGRSWLLLEPDVWIEPSHGRKVAVAFLDARRGDRYNKKFNNLLEAWIQIVLGTADRNVDVTLQAFDDGAEAENPSFRISSRTAFTRRESR